jgi:hypothetical protein
VLGVVACIKSSLTESDQPPSANPKNHSQLCPPEGPAVES